MIEESVSTAERPVVNCRPLKNATRFDALAYLADALGAPIIPMASPRGLKDLSLGAIPELDFVHYEGKQSAYSNRLNKRD